MMFTYYLILFYVFKHYNILLLEKVYIQITTGMLCKIRNFEKVLYYDVGLFLLVLDFISGLTKSSSLP